MGLGLTDALHEALLQHLEAQGVSSSLVMALSTELRSRSSEQGEVEVLLSPPETELQRAFRYATDGSWDLTVRNLAGEALQLPVAASTSIAEVKSLLEARLQVPAREQILLHGEQVLDNGAELLTSYCIGPRTEEVVVIRSQQRHILSSGADGTVRLWGIEGDLKQILSGSQQIISAITADFSSMKALSGAEDGTLSLWDIDHGHLLKTFDVGHDMGINAVAVDWQGMRAISGSDDSCGNNLKMCCLETGQEICNLEGDCSASFVLNVVVDWQGMQLLSGFGDGSLVLWNIQSGDSMQSRESHAGGVWAACADWANMLALTGSQDHSLKLWDLRQGICNCTLNGHLSAVRAVRADWSAMQALSGSHDCTMRMWDLKTGQCLKIFEGHEDSVLTLGVDWSLKLIVSGSRDQTMRLWDLQSGNCDRICQGHLGDVCSVTF
jgi:WD40 repeat protein